MCIHVTNFPLTSDKTSSDVIADVVVATSLVQTTVHTATAASTEQQCIWDLRSGINYLHLVQPYMHRTKLYLDVFPRTTSDLYNALMLEYVDLLKGKQFR